MTFKPNQKIEQLDISLITINEVERRGVSDKTVQDIVSSAEVYGTILDPIKVRKAAMAASAMAAPVAAMPSQAEIVETLDRRPVMSAPAAAPQITREGDTVTINIYPTQGMSVEDIGREVERRLARREDARRADLHDGVDY